MARIERESQAVVAIAANMLELCLLNSSQLLITMELTLLGSNLAPLLIDYEDLVDNASNGQAIPATEAEWDKFMPKWMKWKITQTRF